LIHSSVREAGRAKLPHADPLDVQGEHAALRLIQAADLLVHRGLSDGIVPVDVEDDGDLALERRRLVEERGDPQAGQRLEAKLSDAYTGSTIYRLDPLGPPLRLPPPLRLALQHSSFQNDTA